MANVLGQQVPTWHLPGLQPILSGGSCDRLSPESLFCSGEAWPPGRTVSDHRMWHARPCRPGAGVFAVVAGDRVGLDIDPSVGAANATPTGAQHGDPWTGSNHARSAGELLGGDLRDGPGRWPGAVAPRLQGGPVQAQDAALAAYSTAAR